MLDRLSVDLPKPVCGRDHPLSATEPMQVQDRFWHHLARLTAPARRIHQIRKGFAARQGPHSLSLEGVL